MSIFKLPDLGEGLAEAEIVEWHVKVGDQLRIDRPMVSVETAKAVVEVPAPFTGTVTALHGAPGDIIPTGAPLIEFDSGTVVGHMPATVDEEVIGPAPMTRPRAGDSAGAGRARAVPAARALAKRLSIDLVSLSGTGRGGLITVDDVLNGAHGGSGDRDRTGARGGPVRNGAAAAWQERGGRLEPLRGMRRAMAQSMTLSQAEVAGSTVCDDADLHAWARRGDYMWRLMRAMIQAWRQEPCLNAWYDAGSGSRVWFPHMHLAVAVDTPEGLIVPVVRNVEGQSREELLGNLALRKQAAHDRSLKPEELRDFTLMLSNFGTLAGRYGIPRVVPPAVAILGAGKVREDAVAVTGKVEAHMRMPLSLSFDHRCITGGEACRYLALVIADLERPE
ncbi:MAG TPA: dihydrolipoamide acetyltransferase family protein [Steroidobacteraceae bacterium]|jgi:pyruvate dehydrogenase E2 component (dihydrolipoamide acetyltransferase)|nr:dihydrolipoamide acetyltransferase family protein [Steroidobacteraceae bacterium]